MTLKLLSFSVFLFYFLTGTYSLTSGLKRNHEYDTLILSIAWSPTVTCEGLTNNTTETTCSPCKHWKAINRWTIHGLWPSRRHSSSPLYCSDNPFDPDLLSTELKSQLRLKWPGDEGPDEDFWAHEWEKHGTCSLDLEETNTLPKYFSKTLELYDRYDVRKILDKAKIIPSKKYQLKQIHGALRNSLGVKAFLACTYNQYFRQQFITEIYICFDRLFVLTDCGDNNPYVDSCTSEYDVTYLERC